MILGQGLRLVILRIVAACVARAPQPARVAWKRGLLGESMRRVTMKPDDFPDRVLLRGFEGGAVYTAERAGKFYLIQDESTMAGLLSEEDLVGLDLVKILEFATPSDRATYVRQRGWETSRKHMSGQRHVGEERETMPSFAMAGSQRWLQKSRSIGSRTSFSVRFDAVERLGRASPWSGVHRSKQSAFGNIVTARPWRKLGSPI